MMDENGASEAERADETQTMPRGNTLMEHRRRGTLAAEGRVIAGVTSPAAPLHCGGEGSSRSGPFAGQTTARRAAAGAPGLRHWRRAIVAAVCAGAVAMLAVSCGGGSGGNATKTKSPNAATKAVATPTAGANVGLQTPIAFTPGVDLTAQDLAARGTGPAGRGAFNGTRLVIPSINVNAPFTVKSVPGNGQMPNPNSWNDVVYYDFSAFPGLGGVPGKGGNIVLAGHVDYIHHGPAVFWDLRQLKAGDMVQIQMKDGSVANYQVVFNKHVGADAGDFTSIVSATADESMTLITCTGDFNNGHYNERQIVWAKRV